MTHQIHSWEGETSTFEHSVAHNRNNSETDSTDVTADCISVATLANNVVLDTEVSPLYLQGLTFLFYIYSRCGQITSTLFRTIYITVSQAL